MISKTSAPAAAGRRRGSRPSGSELAIPVLVVAVFVIGALALLYPTASAWIMQYQQSQLISQMSDEVMLLPPENLAEELAAARAYNASLTGEAVLAANSPLPAVGRAAGTEWRYRQLLAANSSGLMARLKIPAISADLPIYHGTSDATLLRGVGHLEGTSLPVGGPSTHAVLTAHRGLANAEMFTNLDRVRVGDTFTVEVYGEVLTYRVRDSRVVQPTETETLRPVLGDDLITLVTCTPLGINTQRILVTGERVTPTPIAEVEAAGAIPEVPGFPWWAIALAAVVLLSSLYLIWFLRPAERGKPVALH